MSWQIDFDHINKVIIERLQAAPLINRNTWQAMDVSDSPMHRTKEIINYKVTWSVPDNINDLVAEVKPDLPWADQHFEERVGRVPLNPPPSHVNWPYHGSNNEAHLENGKQFSHTYPERFWPRNAGDLEIEHTDLHDGVCHVDRAPNWGIRFKYGDLDDVVWQLVLNPLTRQAYLPVWFPEDTGATNRRVPCTLGYHFMADHNYKLHMWYYLRSCDYIRHFHNDVYLAARLLHWVIQKTNFGLKEEKKFSPSVQLVPGDLNLTVSSLHIFYGDMQKLLRKVALM